jgi:WD40 repeat protein
MECSRALIAAVAAIVVEILAMPAPAQTLAPAKRIPVTEQGPVRGRHEAGTATVFRLVDAQGRPVAGAVVGTSFIGDGDRTVPFVPAEGTESQVSDEQGEASLTLSAVRPMGSTGFYAIRPDRDRPLVGVGVVSLWESDKPATIVMHPACRLRLRVECPGFRELETKYHVELNGPNWSRFAYLYPTEGDNVRGMNLLSTSSTTGELEFLLPPGRYTILALGTETIRVTRSVEIQPGHRVKSLGVVEVTPSRAAQQGVFRGFWRSIRADPINPLDEDPTENRPVFRRPRWGPNLKGVTQGIRDLAFSPDGNLLATAAHASGRGPGEVKLCDARTGEPAGALVSAYGYIAVNRLAFSPDGKTLAGVVGSMPALHLPPSIVLWDVAPRRELRVLRGHSASIKTLAFSPDGKTLASGGADRTVRFWEVATGRETCRIEVDPERPDAIAYTPDGTILVVAGGEVLKLWDVPGNRLREKLDPIGFRLQSLAFSPDGKTLAAAAMTDGPQEGKVRLFDMTREPLAGRADLTHDRQRPAGLVVPGPQLFTDVAFTPDGRRVIAISSQTIAIWDTATGVERESLDQMVVGPANRLYASPDGRWLAITDGLMVRLLEIPQPAR